MIHFFDPSNAKMAAKVPDIAKQDRRAAGQPRGRHRGRQQEAAREGLVEDRRRTDFGDCQLWTRVNSLDSPWFLDDLTTLVTEVGDKLDVIMVPKVEGAWDIHYVDRCSPSSRPAPGSRSRSWCTPSSRPPAAWPTSRRSPAPARACRASASAPPTSPPRGA
jgi:hypothetical protein